MAATERGALHFTENILTIADRFYWRRCVTHTGGPYLVDSLRSKFASGGVFIANISEHGVVDRHRRRTARP
jgi:hypothetical protein